MSEVLNPDQLRDLLGCPCWKVPSSLLITDAGQGGKWAWASPNCCGEWSIEFRTNNAPHDSDECKRAAIENWNAAPRAQAAERLEE